MLSFLKNIGHDFNKILLYQSEDRISLHSTTLAYYFIFSLVPLVMLLTALGQLLVGDEITRSWLTSSATIYLGSNITNVIDNIVYTLNNIEANIPLIIIASIFIFYGTTSLFIRLHRAFGDIFNFEDETIGVKASFLKRCQLSLYVILSLLVLVVASLLNIGGNFLLFYGQKILINWTPSVLWIMGNYFLGIIVLSSIFTLVYMIGAKMRLNWQSAVIGGLFGSVLFVIVNSIFSLYASLSLITTVFGPSSFLLVFLLWVNGFFWSVLMGAEIAKRQYCKYPHHRNKICL